MGNPVATFGSIARFVMKRRRGISLRRGCILLLESGLVLPAILSSTPRPRAQVPPAQQPQRIRFAVADDHKFASLAFNGVNGGQSSNLAGVGMVIDQRGDKIVASPFVRGPAYQAGIREGDVILAVDGKSTDHMTALDVIGLLMGPRGSQVHISILRVSEQKRLEFTVTRDNISRAAPAASVGGETASVVSLTPSAPQDMAETSGPDRGLTPAAPGTGGPDAWKSDGQVGDLQFNVPGGWRREQRPDGIVLVPSGLSQNSLVAITFLPPATVTGDPNMWFRATWSEWKGPLNLIDSGEPERKRNPNGFEVLSSYSRAYTPRLGNSVFILAAAVAGNRVMPYFYLCNTNCGYDGYQQDFHDFELSLTLASLGSSMASATGPGTAGGLKGVYRSYKATEGDVALGTFKVRGHAEYLVFFPDGNVIRFLPKEGLENFDFRAAVRKSRESCGRYWVDGNRIAITWGDGGTATGVREGTKLHMGDDMLPYEPVADSNR